MVVDDDDVDGDSVVVDGVAAPADLLMVQIQDVQARQRLRVDPAASEHHSLLSGLVVDDDDAVVVDGAASCAANVGQRPVPSVAPDVKGVDRA